MLKLKSNQEIKYIKKKKKSKQKKIVGGIELYGLHANCWPKHPKKLNYA